MYTVYAVIQSSKCLYIGHTKDLNRREYQHNYSLRKGKEKALYAYLRGACIESITLTPIMTYKKKSDAKRLEMYLILSYLFLDKKPNEVIVEDVNMSTLFSTVDLQQKIPNIRDL